MPRLLYFKTQKQHGCTSELDDLVAINGCARYSENMTTAVYSSRQGSEDKTMEVTIQIPDALVRRLQEQWGDLPRRVLESVVLEGFRERILTTEELRQLLGFETKFEVHAFLKEHDLPFYTFEDLEHDRETSHRLGL